MRFLFSARVDGATAGPSAIPSVCPWTSNHDRTAQDHVHIRLSSLTYSDHSGFVVKTPSRGL